MRYTVHAYQGDESMSYEDCAAFIVLYVSNPVACDGYAFELAVVANLEGETVRPSLHAFAGEGC